MTRMLLKILVNAVSLAAAVKLVSGISFTGAWWMMIIIAVIFGYVNAFIKPFFKFFTFPLLILSLGLFTFVINALMLKLTAWVSGFFELGFHVQGFWPALKGALVVSIVSLILNCATGTMEAINHRNRLQG